MIRHLGALLLCIGTLSHAQAQDAPDIPASVRALERAIQASIERAEPAIASIAVSRSERYRDFEAMAPTAPGELGRFDARHYRNDRRAELAQQLDLSLPDHVPESYGSGVLIDPAGLVLTNYHVVRDAVKVYVRLPGRAGSYANIHAADARADLAVLRMLDPPRNAPSIEIGNGSNLRKGSWVISLANPFATGFRDGSPSASWGIISNLRRRAPGDPREEQRTRALQHYGTLLQIDARLNLGCSGGALLNLDGDLVGLTTSIAALTGGETAGGYAIAIDGDMRRIIETLREGREVEYGFLGVSIAPPSPFAAIQPGIALAGVTPGSPAWQAGLRANDSIISVNGKVIRDYDDLFLFVGSALAGNSVELGVRTTTGGTRKLSIRLAKFAHPLPWIASNRGPSAAGIRVEYTSVLIDGNRQFGDLPIGVLLREVEPNTPAATALKPLLDGNGRIVITQVNGQAVQTPADFYAAVNKAKRLQLRIVDPTRLDMEPRDITIPE